MNEYIDRIIALLRKGWCQGSMYRDANGLHLGLPAASYCLKGAVFHERGGKTLEEIRANNELRDELLSRLRKHCPVPYGSRDCLVIYNDNSDRKVEEIIALLEKCKDADEGSNRQGNCPATVGMV